jgi:hypothetical protein
LYDQTIERVATLPCDRRDVVNALLGTEEVIGPLELVGETASEVDGELLRVLALDVDQIVLRGAGDHLVPHLDDVSAEYGRHERPNVKGDL